MPPTLGNQKIARQMTKNSGPTATSPPVPKERRLFAAFSDYNSTVNHLNGVCRTQESHCNPAGNFHLHKSVC